MNKWFPILKIVVVAMMLAWVALPSQVFAYPTCNQKPVNPNGYSSCMSQCGSQAASCNQACYTQVWIQSSCYSTCNQVFNNCATACYNNYCI
jgi:hypothetical protein